jgi:hypothetical protein
MTLEEAVKQIKLCSDQMDARYTKPVFDEWALIAVQNGKGHVLAYMGPRKSDFHRSFLEDVGPLRQGLLTQDNTIGDFEFVRDGVGTTFESYMVAGDGLFLICNNTVQSMDAISRDPLWLGAQVPFVELSERFQVDPLVA